MKRILAILLFLAILQAAFAADEGFPNGFFYEGNLLLDSNMRNLNAGEDFIAEITLQNNGPNPIPEAYVVIELAKGSIKSGLENVIMEKKINGINLPANSIKKMALREKLPSDLKQGTYRLDAYFRTSRTPVVGLPAIFISPVSFVFNVWEGGNFSQAKILRETKFNNTLDQIGAPAEPDSIVDGNVVIENISDKDLSNLTLSVGLCDWDDTSCTFFTPCPTCSIGAERPFQPEDWEKEIKIDSLKAGEIKGVQVDVKAPSVASAYAVRLELKDSTGRLLSLYRNRIIVKGATKKIDSVFINNHYFKPKDTVELSSLIGPSPDHYDPKAFEGSNLVLSVKNLETGNEVYKNEIPLEGTYDFVYKKASFVTEEELKKFEVCGRIVKDSKEYDSHCYNIDAVKFEEVKGRNIKLAWTFEPGKKLLTLNFCGVSPAGFPTKLSGEYYLTQGTTTISAGKLDSSECEKKEFSVTGGKYKVLIMNKFDGAQKTEEIDIDEFLKHCENLNCNDNNPCTLDSCAQGKCSNTSLPDEASCGSGKTCRSGQCIEKSAFDSSTIIIVIILLAIIVIGFVLVKVRK